MVEDIFKYRPSIRAVPQARILLVGPVGAGKSSFFNSVNSMFRGRMTCQAIAGTADKSVTTQVLLLKNPNQPALHRKLNPDGKLRFPPHL